MRIIMTLAICMVLQMMNAQEPQEAQAKQATYETIDLKEALAKKHTAENMDELIDLGNYLPIEISEQEKDSEEWILDRQKSIGLYLKWYQKMFAAGFKLDYVAIKTAQSERTIQKNKAIKSYLIAEQRLKRYLKNNYKGNKKKQFLIAAQAYGTNYDITAERILSDVLNPEFGFVVYEKSVRVD